MLKNNSLLMNTTEAAKRLGFCKRVFMSFIYNKEIKYIEKNGRYYFKEEYLEEFINKMENETGENTKK